MNRSLIIDAGLYKYRLNGLPDDAKRSLFKLYGVAAEEKLCDNIDFTLDLSHTSLFRRFIKPNLSIKLDGQNIFNPFVKSKSLPSVEWAMNWCVASYEFTRLLIHSAVVVKNGIAILLPASQGSGKSTLSTYLASQGWELYSDETAIIDLNTSLVLPIYRPAALKNESIQIIKRYFPESHFSTTTVGTQKGAIAHVMPRSKAHYSQLSPAPVKFVVLPKYSRLQKSLDIISLTKAQTAVKCINNSFNYGIIGGAGFNSLYNVISSADGFTVKFSELDQVASFLDYLIEEQ